MTTGNLTSLSRWSNSWTRSWWTAFRTMFRRPHQPSGITRKTTIPFPDRWGCQVISGAERHGAGHHLRLKIHGRAGLAKSVSAGRKIKIGGRDPDSSCACPMPTAGKFETRAAPS